jgi:Ca2+-binding RTX toxin-like protein
VMNGTRQGDALFGLRGDDTLHGGRGGDTLHGGAGRDTATYAQATSHVVVDLNTASLNRGQAAGDRHWSVERLLGSIYGDTMSGNLYDNGMRGGAGTDVLVGRDGDDWLGGDAGADSLWGGAGDDTLLGGTGNDRFYGGDGRDNLAGHSGWDVLTGGAGADTFRFVAGSGTDRITDFVQGVDDMVLSRALVGTATTGAQVVARFGAVVSGDVVLTFADGSRVILQDVGSLAGLAGDISII